MQKLERPVDYYERVRYNDEDMEHLANQFLSQAINGSVIWKEIWDRRTVARLVLVEEGIVNAYISDFIISC